MKKRTKTILDAYEREQRKQRVITLLKEGTPVAKIQKVTGMSSPSIYLYKKKLKVKRRNLSTPVIADDNITTMENLNRRSLADYINKPVGIAEHTKQERLLLVYKKEINALKKLMTSLMPLVDSGYENLRTDLKRLLTPETTSNEGH